MNRGSTQLSKFSWRGTSGVLYECSDPKNAVGNLWSAAEANVTKHGDGANAACEDDERGESKSL